MNTNTQTTTTSHQQPKPMKIAISGGGPAGLTLAAILDREGNIDGKDAKFDVTVFERGSADRDQGSGWDMNVDALATLRRAGLDPSTIQRPGSDTMRFYKMSEGGEEEDPMYTLQMPTLLEKMGLKKKHVGLDELNLETERTKLINGLLSNLENNKNIRVKHKQYIAGANRNTAGGVELLDRDGSSLGTFDAVIDAAGVNSPLRRLRFGEGADAFYTGNTLVQYNVKSPEKFWDEDILGKLGEGTMGIYGPTPDGKGTMQLFIQRYGANLDDGFLNINHFITNEDPNQVAKELGVTGRYGYLDDKEIVARFVEEGKRRLAHNDWPQQYRDMFDCVEGVRVLPIYMHPTKDVVEKEIVDGSDDLPFIGIGDALHALSPWSGMSGNYALMDAADLATALLEEQAKSDSEEWTPVSLAKMFREKERLFIDRTEERRKETIQRGKYMTEYLPSTPIHEFDWISCFVINRPFSWTDLEAVCVSVYLRLLTFLNRWDNYRIPLKNNSNNKNKATAKAA